LSLIHNHHFEISLSFQEQYTYLILPLTVDIGNSFYHPASDELKMIKVLSQVRLSKRWSSLSAKDKKPSLSSASSGGSNLSCLDFNQGIFIGTYSIEGRYHKNEDVVVDGVSFAELAENIPRYTSSQAQEDSEAKVDEEERTLNLDHLFFTAVFDGHGGSDCSKYMAEALKANLADLLSQHPMKSFEEFCSSTLVTEAFAKCELDYRTAFAAAPSGCCVAMAIVYGNSFLLAWLGDCRAVLYSGDNVLPVTKDHRTTNQQEFNRIISQGGQVVNDRVMGILAPTRAFGDNDIKRTFPGLVSAEPSILSFTIDEASVPSDTSFLVIATDGVFDALSNDRACDIVSKSLAKITSANEAARRLAEAGARANSDDVSASVILWNHKLRKSLAAKTSTSAN